VYTNDCWSKFEIGYIVKYVDDCVIVTLLHEQDLKHCGTGSMDFVSCCDHFSLQLNVNETKDKSSDDNN